MTRSTLLLLVFCLAASLLPQGARAVTFSPIKLELSSSGPGATDSFVVTNNTKTREAIEVSAAVRAMDLNGNETNPTAEDLFMIYPPQLVLEPGEQRNVRVTWIGGPTPSKELAFRVICEQLPVNLAFEHKGVGGAVRLLVRYLASVYIVPKGSKPDVVVDSVSGQRNDAGADTLVIVLNNKGTAHALLRSLVVRLTSPASTVPLTLTERQLEGMAGENILAQSARRFVLPWPDKLPKGPVTVAIDLDRSR